MTTKEPSTGTVVTVPVDRSVIVALVAFVVVQESVALAPRLIVPGLVEKVLATAAGVTVTTVVCASEPAAFVTVSV